MPVQTPQWTDVLCCCICYNVFDGVKHQPVSLVCGHTACRGCLLKLKSKQCPFDQSAINIPVADLLQNSRILKILDIIPPNEEDKIKKLFEFDDGQKFKVAIEILEQMTIYLKRAASERGGSVWSPQLSRPMQRKLVNLLCCNLVEPEGRSRALKAVRSLGERSLTELLLMHQNPYHLSSNLWATVRARGCQFLGPAMQEEVLKLVLLALSEGALISRKVLVMYIVQTLEKEYPQASKTSVGHVVQLLYRASCFNVIKRDGESSLMQLKEDFRTYESLRREHDAQIVQIAMEAGLRISPDQWSALLYGDQTHKSHMQSIIDRLQTPQSFFQCIQELLIGLQRTGDPGHLVDLRIQFELLSEIDPSQGENSIPSWSCLVDAFKGVKAVVDGQVKFCENYNNNKNPRENVERSVVAYKFKTSMCRDIGEGKTCPRCEACTFAHSLEEMERYRARSRLMGYRSNSTRSGADENLFGELDGEFISEKDFFPPRSDKERITPQWNAQMHPLEMEQQRKPFIVGPNGFQQNLIPQPNVPPPQLPPMPPTVQQIIATEMTATPVLTATPPPPPPLGSVLAPPPNAIMTPNGNVAFAHHQPFPMNAAMPPMPQFGAVRYQIIRPNAGPPTQVTSQISAPISVTATPDYGYYWYPPTGPGGFQSRASLSGEILHLEVPLARVVAGPSHNLPPGYSEYFANQQTFAPPMETFYMYQPSGIPVRFDESNAYQYRPQMQATMAVIPTGTNIYPPQFRQQRPVAEEVQNEWSGPRNEPHCQAIIVEKNKKGKLQTLEKKREEILMRLDSLRKTDQKENYNSTENVEDGTNDIVVNMAACVLRDDLPCSFPSSGLKVRSSQNISCNINVVESEDQSNCSSSWTANTSPLYQNLQKDTLAPTSSVPLLAKHNSKQVQRSLSTENEVKTKGNLYSPWNTRSPYDLTTSNNVWHHDTTSASSSCSSIASSTSCKTANTTSSTAYYATRPYIPEDYIDIKHLNDDILKKELQQLSQTSKRCYYVRLELESRERDTWRSDDDQVIPFSGGPHVSRYGPIARGRIALTSNSLIVSPSSTTTIPSDLVHVKDTIQQPLPTAVVQPPKDQPIMNQTHDPSSIDVSSIPIVFQASLTTTMDPAMVGEKLDKVLEMKEKLESLPMIDGASSVEREQLKIDLDIINKEIATLDKETEEECLLKELESVNFNIEELQQK